MESAEQFSRLLELLQGAGLEFSVNQRLVRGLDYYNRTVFEWLTDSLGAQGTVCAGGRYDSLVETVGGKSTPAAGFAMGMERLILMLQGLEELPAEPPAAEVYFVAVGDEAQLLSLQLAERARDQLVGRRLLVHNGGGSFRSQMKKADKSGASLAVIIGEQEVADGTVGLKQLRQLSDQGEQQTLPQAALVQRISELLEQERL